MEAVWFPLLSVHRETSHDCEFESIFGFLIPVGTWHNQLILRKTPHCAIVRGNSCVVTCGVSCQY